MAATSDKPILVAAAYPAAGHTAGVLQLAQYLSGKGFKIYFIGGVEFKASIEKAGAEFIDFEWDWTKNWNEDEGGNVFYDMKHVFADATPTAFRVLKDTLERVREKHPDRKVMMLQDSMALGSAPFMYGAPLPKGYTSFPRVISFHTSIYAAHDYSVPPFGAGMPYDPTPENLAMWRSIYDSIQPQVDDLSSYFNNIYRELGATRPMTGAMLDGIIQACDLMVMATTPSLDYPIASSNPKVRFIGGLPLKPLDPNFAYPDWWPLITANSALPASSPEKKKVVFVSQGTVHRDYTELLIPTLKVLSGRKDLIVIATLGARGATPPAELDVLPDNFKIVDYFPYDALLPHTDVFVSNAGYGGFMHGIMNGVPMVLAGTKADKAEVCQRAEWAGVGVNLRAQNPSGEAIREAVDKVLGDGKFKARALELKKENEQMNCLETFEKIVYEIAAMD